MKNRKKNKKLSGKKFSSNKQFNKKQGKNSFFQDKKNVHRENAQKMSISEITLNLKGRPVFLEAVVDRINQTAGPTVFFVSDGTGTLALKAFEGAGVRSFPDIEEGDAIGVSVNIEEFRDELEGDITSLKKLNETETKNLQSKIKNIQRERAKPVDTDFLVKSKILDKLRPEMLKAATEIRLAITQNRPIIVRHHNDADGYSSGYALERAILPLIEKQHGFGKSAWEFYTRAPCAAPFYEIDDSIRDTSNSLRNVAKFSNKMPLVIIADNGSSEQDLFAIQQGKVHGMDFIVIDHHYFEKDLISKEVLAHINPFLVGEDGSHFSAGMLCTEFARFISPVETINFIPALAGLADRIDNQEAMKQYLILASKEGYSEKLLSDISTVIDFVSAKIRFMEAREYIEVIFGEPRNKQKELVSLMAPYIRNLEKKGLEIAKNEAKREKLKKVTLQYLSIEDTLPGFGFYPKTGKIIGQLHDLVSEKVKALVSAGILNSAMTLRATDEANFSVHDFIAFLHKKIPDAFVEGGGHKNAGSITFVPKKKEKIFELLKEFINKR